MNRRTLLKVGVVGGALLAIGGGAATLLGRDAMADRNSVLQALIPAVLEGVPDFAKHSQQALASVNTAIGGLPLATQAELNQLFSLLAAPPTRYLLTGLSNPWSEVTPAQAAEVLQGWRFHRLDLLQSAYHAMHDLIIGGWYGDETHWRAMKYTPPQAFN